MRRLLFLFALPLLAQNQLKNPIALGFYDIISQTNGASLALNASGEYLGFSFVAQAAKTLNTVYVYANAVNGTMGSSDLVCALYSDSSGVPGSAIQSTSTVAATPTTAAIVEFTGLSTTLTAGTQYWIVLSNANGTAATNYPTYFLTQNVSNTGNEWWVLGNGAGAYGWNSIRSANSGSTWVTEEIPQINMMLGYSDSSFEGRLWSAMSAEAVCSHGQTEYGVSFILPSNATYNVIGASFLSRKTGTPGTMAFKLYSTAPTLLGTTTAIPVASVSTTAGWYTSYFSSDVVLTGGVNYYATILDGTSSDTSSNEYCTQTITVPNLAAILALKPLNGNVSQVTTSNQGTSFSTTTTTIIPFALLLDTNGEFHSQGGGAIIPVSPIQ